MKKIKLVLFIIITLMLTHASGQEDKTVTLTVSGQGKTQDEAKNSALRNAIEQAFGAFISSNTEILNDELIKDEIISISNGNIQSFEILSEVQMPDGTYSNTVKAVVSVNKLTTFCENKGISVEFKGGLFAINAKQQILNEENELKAILNMCNVLKEISKKSFDFEILVSEPYESKKRNGQYCVPIEIHVKTNNNFVNISNYFNNTLKGLSLTKDEVDNYKSLKKNVYSCVFIPLNVAESDGSYLGKSKNQNDLQTKKSSTVKNTNQIKDNDCIVNVYYLRSSKSIESIIDFIYDFKKSLLGFEVSNGVKIYTGNSIMNNSDYIINGVSTITKIGEERENAFYFFDNVDKYVSAPVIMEGSKPIKFTDVGFTPLFKYDLTKPGLKNISIFEKYNNYEFESTYYRVNNYQLYNATDNKISDFVKLYFPNLYCIQEKYKMDVYDIVVSFGNIGLNKRVVVFKYFDNLSIDDISKITEYKIMPINK